MSVSPPISEGAGAPAARVRIPISWKLLGATIVVGVVAVGIAVAGLRRMHTLNERFTKTVDYSSESVKLAALLKQDLVSVTRAEKNLILARSDEEMNRFAATIDDKLAAMQANQERLRNRTDIQERTRLDLFSEKWDQWRENHDAVRNFVQLNSDLRARQLALGKGRESFERLESAAEEMAAANMRTFESVMKQPENLVALAQRIQTLAHLQSALTRIQRAEKQIILAPTDEEMQAHEAAFDAIRKEVGSDLESLGNGAEASRQELAGDARKALATYVDAVSEMRSFLGQKQNFFVRHFAYEIGGPLSAECERLLDEIAAKNERDIQAYRDESQHTYVVARNSLVGFGVAGILLSVVVSFFTGQRIARNLGRLADYAHQVQMTGDLSRPPPRVGRDEVGLVAESFDHMCQSLHRQTSELEALNEALSQKNEEMEQFVYTVSHDLRSPLVSCKGLIGFIKEDVADGNYEKVVAAVGMLDTAVEQLNQTIDDLLTISRIGRKSLNLTNIDMHGLIDGLSSELGPRFAEAEAKLRVEGTLPTLLADAPDVKRVFENLLINAIKYGCDEPDQVIAIGGHVTDREVLYYVRDTGPGIEPEYHEKIFGLFQRLDTDKPGTGLGLASVSKILRVHGGRVWVQSTPGEGATFWVAFTRPMT